MGPSSTASGPPFRSPACFLTRSPHPKSSLAAGTSPASAQLSRSRARLLPLLGFKLKFPDWGRQRTHHVGPAPSKRKPLLRPRRTRPRHENPSGFATAPTPRPGHAPEAVPPPLPAGFLEIRLLVLQAGRTADSQRCPG